MNTAYNSDQYTTLLKGYGIPHTGSLHVFYLNRAQKTYKGKGVVPVALAIVWRDAPFPAQG